jgi:hypothetical protein
MWLLLQRLVAGETPCYRLIKDNSFAIMLAGKKVGLSYSGFFIKPSACMQHWMVKKPWYPPVCQIFAQTNICGKPVVGHEFIIYFLVNSPKYCIGGPRDSVSRPAVLLTFQVAGISLRRLSYHSCLMARESGT